MKTLFVTILGLALSCAAFAQNTTSFDKSASIVSSETFRRSVFNGRSFLDPHTALRIENHTYFTSGVCNGVKTGDVFPAQISKKKAKLLIGEKVCSLSISSVE